MQLVIIERRDGKHQHNADQSEHTLTENEVIAVSVIVIRVGIACGEHHDKSHGKQHKDQKQHGHVKAETQSENSILDTPAPFAAPCGCGCRLFCGHGG